MTDIVERLRAANEYPWDVESWRDLAVDAADEIERLHACLKERDALCKRLEGAIPITIERCAQVADSMNGIFGHDAIAAAIRALEDKP